MGGDSDVESREGAGETVTGSALEVNCERLGKVSLAEELSRSHGWREKGDGEVGAMRLGWEAQCIEASRNSIWSML